MGIQKHYFNTRSKLSTCPICHKIEDQHHYLVCQGERWKKARLEVWKMLKKKLQFEYMNPNFVTDMNKKCNIDDILNQ